MFHKETRMSAPHGRGIRRTAILAALATSAAIAVPAHATDSEPLDQGQSEPTPRFRVLTEVLDPASGTYVDGDADLFSRGTNDGFRPTLGVGHTAYYKVWVFNTGDVDLHDLRVRAPGCGLDELVSHLPAGDPDPYVRLSCSRVVTTPPEVCVLATVRDPLADDPSREGRYVVRDEQSERACVIVRTPPRTEEPSPPPPPPAPRPAPAPAPQTDQPVTPTPASAPPRRARLAISKVGRARVVAGARTRWHIRVRSTGSATARKVVLRDRIPRGFSVAGAKIRLTTRVNGRMVNRWRPVRYAVRRGNLMIKLGPMARGRTAHVRVWMRAAKNARGARVNIATANAANARPVRARAPITILRAKPTRIAPAVTG